MNSGDDADHVNVAHEESGEKDGNHDECPDRSGPEVGLFLFVLSLLLFGGGRLLYHKQTLANRCISHKIRQ